MNRIDSKPAVTGFPRFKISSGRKMVCLSFLMMFVGCLPTIAQAQQPDASDRVTALKTTLGISQANLRHYQWIETTEVSLKGEVKSSQQKSCYYGADGVLQKVDVVAPPPADNKRGIRGRVIANKKAELTTYMQSAIGLVKTYVPPDPAKLQAVKDAGDVTIQPLGSGKSVRLAFQNYEKPGDSLDVELNLETNAPTGISVATYLDSPSDAVNLGVIMAQLDDGNVYASTVTLDAPAKNLVVTVTNSGYRKTGS